MGQTIHQFAINNKYCPIKAITRRIHHILLNRGNSDNLICDVFNNETSTWKQITSKNMIINVREAVTSLKLDQKGINTDLVGVHSLRAGGAMALKLNGTSDTTIMKMGRWTSMTFLQYIHNQIAHLGKDLSKRMSTELDFQNIAAIEKA